MRLRPCLPSVSSFVILAACAPGVADAPPPAGAAQRDGGSSRSSSRDASPVFRADAAPLFGAFDGGARSPALSPASADLVVDPTSATPGTVQFTVDDPGTEPPVWTLTNVGLGSVDGSGLFVASGKMGGETDVVARIGSRTLVGHVVVKVAYRQNGATAATLPGGGAATTAGGVGGVGGDGAGAAVTGAALALLDGTPSADPALSILYPYDKTVFPLGVLPPLLQWTSGKSGNFDGIRIHVSVPKYFDYIGFFGRPAGLAATADFVRHPIPDDVWTAATATAAGGNLDVELALSAGGQAWGPLRETFLVAPGKISGTVYYQAYNTALAKNYDGALSGGRFGGATLSIAIGAEGPRLVAGKTTADATGCRVCHSVSAYGDRMLVQHGDDYGVTSLYDLRNGNQETTPYAAKQFDRGFAGIHPNGQLALPSSVGVGGAIAPENAALYDVPTGAAVPTTGLADFATKIALPMFAPDGKHVAFTFFDGPSTAAVGPPTGRQLVVMDFDGTTNAFSNPRKIWETTATNERPAWPTFFPSGSALVFMRHVEGTSAEAFGSRSGARGDLLWTDLATGTTTPLDALNGTGYLPSGPNAHDADDRLQYEPTISPVPSGGYAWIVFMSRRLYGNVATIDPWWSDPRDHDLVADVTPKKLWMAAIDLDPKPGTDPSHPAFYVPGQELHGSNSRPFFALDPCIDDGGTCGTGVDCCGGYCIDGLCGKLPPPHGCSSTGDRCTATSDCCSERDRCVNSVCSLVLR